MLAVKNFDTENPRLSAYIIIEELTSALMDRRIQVVARHSIEYIQRELDFQTSGYVNQRRVRDLMYLTGLANFRRKMPFMV